MIGESSSVALEVRVDEGTASSTQAVSIGLIVTELVINALKHAFRADTAGGRIVIAYDVAETGWRLTVSDNGLGESETASTEMVAGLGTSIVEALAKQLDANVAISMTSDGTAVSVSHGTMPPLISAKAGSVL